MTLYTSKVIAQWLCLTERRVRQLRDEGVIVEARPGLYELQPTVARYIKYLGGAGKESLNTERMKLTAEKRKAAEMDNDLRRGDLHSTQDIEKGIQTMCLNIRSRFLAMNISITKKTSTHNTTAAAGRAIRYIVVHYTAGVTSKPGSAAGTASYFGSTSKQVSADFIVDDGGAVQYNGDIRNRYTWHCGGGKYNTKGGAYYGKATNRNTIGIEVCSTNDTGKMTVANDSHWRFTDKVVSNLVELVKYLMAEYGIDAAHVIRHYDVNGKPCPGIIGWNEDTGSAAKWAAFKARLGAATPGGQTGGSTNTGTATGNTALTYKVGDIVQFAGGKHYANAQAASGTTVKPGPAKVTAVATAGKHPYHLVHTDSTSTVYGWVDAAAITGKASATPAAKTYTVKAGDSLWRIAAQQLGNGARYKEIKTLNGLKNNTIHAGQVLKLPN